MGSHSSPVTSDFANPASAEIEDLLDQFADASKTAPTAADFYRLLVDRIVPSVGASGGAIWVADAAGPRLAYAVDVTAPPQHAQAGWAEHASLVEEVIQANQPRVVPLRMQADAQTSSGNPTDCTLVVHPFQIGPDERGAIALSRRRTMPSSEASAYLRLMAALAELTEDFHRNHQLGQLRELEHHWREYELFALRVHRSLDLTQTAYLIANEGRRLIGCDRASVLACRGGKCRALATSGVDTLDRRAELVRRLERLANRCAATGDAVWYSDVASDISAEIEEPLHAYLDKSHARVLAIVPLVDPQPGPHEKQSRVIGLLVIEQFQSPQSETRLRQATAVVAGHSAVALHNALAHSELPLSAIGRKLATIGWLAQARQLPRTIVALSAIAALVAAACLVPADFDIEAKGEFQPVVRRDVFASDDGVVSELLADHGRAVKAGEPVFVLRKPELDLEFSKVAGEMQTAQKKLAAIRAERLTNKPAGPDTRRSVHQLTADEEELKKQLEGLQAQREILEQQRTDLVVRSPIDGQALTWNVKELLEARPVERGQTLLSVADLGGPWQLELRLADRRSGHVLAARDELKKNLDVSFALSSEPGKVYEGKMADVALSTDLDEASDPTVLVKVAFDRNEVAGLRPGATAIARIHCGRRAIGYVWLHDLFEAIQSHWWW